MQKDFNVYSIKELEKLVPKYCSNISPMIVKDLVQQLLDEDSDGIIFVEKCGISNVYWSFKNQAHNKMIITYNNFETKIDEKKKKIEELKSMIDLQEKGDRNPDFTINKQSFNRLELINKVKELKDNEILLKQELEKNIEKKWTKTTLETKKKELYEQRDTLENLTDNIEIMLEYLARKYSLQSSELRKELEIPEEFVTIEL